jgi:hypothetical protein
MIDTGGSWAIHAVVLHPRKDESWLASARAHDLRAHLAAGITELVSGFEEQAIIAFPAGFFVASSSDSALQTAEGMLHTAASNRAGLLFGVTIGARDRWAPLGPPDDHLGFVCDGRRRAVWATDSPAVVHVRGRRIGVLFGRDLFDRGKRDEVIRGRPDVILVLTAAGATPKWHALLARLQAVAPTIVVGEAEAGTLPAWSQPPSNWMRREVSSIPSMTLVKYEPMVTPALLYQAFTADAGGAPRSVKH